MTAQPPASSSMSRRGTTSGLQQQPQLLGHSNNGAAATILQLSQDHLNGSGYAAAAQSFPLAHYGSQHSHPHQHHQSHHQHQHHQHPYRHYAQPNEYTRPPPPPSTSALLRQPDAAHYSVIDPMTATTTLCTTPSSVYDVHPNGHKTLNGRSHYDGGGSHQGPALPMRNGHSATLHANGTRDRSYH